MDIQVLKKQIQTNSVPSFIIFAGDEWKVQEVWIKQISKVTGKSIKSVDSITGVWGSIKNTSIIKSSFIYVARDDKEFMQNEKLQNAVRTGALKDNIFILKLTSIDKRTKFYKQFQADLVMFEPLNDIILKKYITKEILLDDKNCEKLIDICEKDYGRILLEIDKVQRYADTFNLSEPAQKFDKSRWNIAFEKLVKDGTIYEPPYDAIFDLVDAILDRKVNVSYNLLHQSYAVGEATMVMLSVLYNNTKSLLQVQACTSKDVAKTTGLTGWQIKNAQKHLNKYRNGELVKLMRLIHRVQKEIKLGLIDDDVVMDYILVNTL